MSRKINEKARNMLGRSLILGATVLFAVAVTGCDELSASSDATSVSPNAMSRAISAARLDPIKTHTMWVYQDNGEVGQVGRRP